VPLQLFEPRYIDMLTRCLKEDRGFAIVMLRKGLENSRAAAFYDIGTYVRIVDFEEMPNGFLGITVEGLYKVAVIRSWQQEDGLNVADVEGVLEEHHGPVPEAFQDLTPVLKALLKHPLISNLEMDVDFNDARHVGWRLTELLPLDNREKQALVEFQDPLARLDRLQVLLKELE